MSRPRNKADLLKAGAEYYAKLIEMADGMSEKEMNTPFDFSGDPSKKERHWGRDKNLREIRPPHIPFGWWFWIFVLLAVASCVYAWTTWRRHKAQAGLSLRATRDDRPCDKIALSQLDSLLASGLWERQAYKLFYITLSDILREYLWHRFQTDVSADTSAELVRRVKSIPLLEPQITPLRDFLNSGDLVKFAKVQPSENTRNKDVQFLRGLIQATAPQEAASKPEENK